MRFKSTKQLRDLYKGKFFGGTIMKLQTKYFLIILTVILSFGLSGCKEQTDDIETCTVIYESELGVFQESTGDIGMLLAIPPINGYYIEGYYKDANYTKEIQWYYACYDDNIVYVKQVLSEYALDVVDIQDMDITIDKTFLANHFTAYITTDGCIYIQYLITGTEYTLLLETREYLPLEPSEEIVDIQSYIGYVFYLTNTHRVIIQQLPTSTNSVNGSFQALSNIDTTFLEDYQVSKIAFDWNFIYIFTIDKQLLTFTRDDDGLTTLFNITDEINQNLTTGTIDDIYSYRYGNEKIIIKDTNSNFNSLWVDYDDFSFNLINYEDITFSIINYESSSIVPDSVLFAELEKNLDEDILYNNELYRFMVSSVYEIKIPDTMVQTTETPIEYQWAGEGKYYLTDEHLYYYEPYYDLAQSKTSYISYNGDDYLELTQFLPLEPGEKVINIATITTINPEYQLYMLTNQGRIFVSNPYNFEGDIKRPNTPYPVEILNDTYHLDEDEYVIELFHYYDFVKLVTNKGTIIYRDWRLVDDSPVFVEQILKPQTIEIFNNLVSIGNNVETMIENHYSTRQIDVLYLDPMLSEPHGDNYLDPDHKILLFITFSD